MDCLFLYIGNRYEILAPIYKKYYLHILNFFNVVNSNPNKIRI